jgi:exonuclease-1
MTEKMSNLSRYVDFAMHRVKMVKYFGVTPYLVFDGDFLPSKASTEASREKRREDSRKAGLEYLKAGKPSQEHQELQKAIDVTPEMARHLIEELKKAGVPYVVAPYEADAQLVYLERQGIINGIISEDSDLLVFGAKRLLTKMDQHGQCVEINRRDFCSVREISLTGWTDAEFRQMAIFSGCDYLEGVGNMGLKTAYRMIRKHKTPERVIRMLQFDGKFKVSENYLAAFKQAELTFLHQRVFCPKAQQIVLLTTPDSSLDVENMPFIGASVEIELARAIAVGDVNPITKRLISLPNLPEKRKMSAVQVAPAAGKPRPPGKPINSYFQGDKRIPLGEMDPNCFVVEPGQVANLTQHGLLPRVFPLPRPYLEDAQGPTNQSRPYTSGRLQRRRTEPIGRMLGLANADTSSEARRRTAGPLGHRRDNVEGRESGTTMPPPKKVRLCDEILSKEESQGTERSKFFPTKASPAIKNKEAPLLLSDDSIEEALLDLPDVDGWQPVKSPKRMPKLEIFEENEQEKSQDQKEEVILNSDVEIATSLREELVETVEPPVTRPPEEAVESLRAFSYTPRIAKPPPRQTFRMSQGLPTPVSATTTPSSSLETSSTHMQTPLQRLGSQALQRKKLSFSPPATPASSGSSAARERNRRSYTGYPVNPSFVPLPKVDLAEVEALNRPLGSEDQIIPRSDGETDDEAEEHNQGRQPLRPLDLSRFLYN